MYVQFELLVISSAKQNGIWDHVKLSMHLYLGTVAADAGFGRRCCCGSSGAGAGRLLALGAVPDVIEDGCVVLGRLGRRADAGRGCVDAA